MVFTLEFKFVREMAFFEVYLSYLIVPFLSYNPRLKYHNSSGCRIEHSTVISFHVSAESF